MATSLERGAVSEVSDLMDRPMFMKLISRAGIAAVAGVGSLFVRLSSAAASPPDYPCDENDGCCCLKQPPGGCPGSGSSHTCPSGSAKRMWTCCGASGTLVRFCSECTTTPESGCWPNAARTTEYKCSETWVGTAQCN